MLGGEGKVYMGMGTQNYIQDQKQSIKVAVSPRFSHPKNAGDRLPELGLLAADLGLGGCEVCMTLAANALSGTSYDCDQMGVSGEMMGLPPPVLEPLLDFPLEQSCDFNEYIRSGHSD